MSSIKLSIEDDDPWAISQNIFVILSDFVQNSSSTSAENVASSISAQYPDNRPPQDSEKESASSFLLEMWDVVLKVAIQLAPGSAEQDKLVSFIKALRNIEPQQTMQIWGSPIVLWKDLPLLGAAMTEKLNTIPSNALFSDHDAWAKDRQRLQSFHAFAALLTKDGYDCSSHALGLLSSALEYPLDSERFTGTVSNPDANRHSGPALWSVISAGKFWILQCNSMIYKRSKDDNTGSTNAKGPLWNGNKGFSLARYQLWKRRFSEISQNDKVDEHTRLAAADAQKEMKESES
ncbi:hypothetical protein MMC18_009068 [Xylographa bjoerkii]|nr:hypothetical protein [Xylographa bjoerkii]